MADTWVESEFEAIFREQYERLVRTTRRVLQRDAEAEEVCSDTFLKLYRSGPGVVAAGSAGAWLYRVATRAAIDRLRASKRRGIQEELSDSDGEGGGGEDPLDRVMRHERIAEVRAVLAELKPEKAQLLLLRHSGLSYQEVAAAMQIQPASVGTMLARAEDEFSAYYRRRQRPGRRAPQLEIAKEGQ